MSEIAKCPLCGKDMSIYVYRQRLVVSCDSEDCSFRCNNDDLPRIAAAMELADSLSSLDKCDAKTQHLWEQHVDMAEKRVLEVFK